MPAYKTIGFWLALVIAAMQGLNAIRALADPAGFADYLGMPLHAEADAVLLGVYAMRAAFIAIFVALMLRFGKFSVLAWMALVAIIMPVGDAGFAARAGAETETIARHLVIAVYLLFTFFFLRRLDRQRRVATG